MKPLSITIDPSEPPETRVAPTGDQLARQAAQWFADIKEFRAWEDSHLFAEHAPSLLDQRIHRYQLSALMTEGEMLLLGIALHGEPISLSGGVTAECIEANRRSLQLTFLGWYGEMAKERRQALCAEIFDDPQPAV